MWSAPDSQPPSSELARTAKRRRVALLLGCSLAFLMCSACFVIPVRGKLSGPGGTTGSVNLSFLKIGTTHRDEVKQRLEPFDVRIENDSLFWGRWEREWNVYWFAGAGTSGGGGDVAVQRRSNVLIEFDSSGTAVMVRTAGDRDVLGELTAAVRRMPQAGKSPEGELRLQSLTGEEIVVGNDEFSFGGVPSGELRLVSKFSVVTRLNLRVSESRADRIPLRLDTSTAKRFGRKVHRNFDVTPQDLYRLVKYAESSGLDRILPQPETLPVSRLPRLKSPQVALSRLALVRARSRR